MQVCLKTANFTHFVKNHSSNSKRPNNPAFSGTSYDLLQKTVEQRGGRSCPLGKAVKIFMKKIQKVYDFMEAAQTNKDLTKKLRRISTWGYKTRAGVSFKMKGSDENFIEKFIIETTQSGFRVNIENNFFGSFSGALRAAEVPEDIIPKKHRPEKLCGVHFRDNHRMVSFIFKRLMEYDKFLKEKMPIKPKPEPKKKTKTRNEQDAEIFSEFWGVKFK